MDGKTDKTVELSEDTLDAAAGGISDGTSNTVLFAEQIPDGTSNANAFPGNTKYSTIKLTRG